MEQIQIKILEAFGISSLNSKAQEAVNEGWRPIGGPFNAAPEKLGWAFIKTPPPPQPQRQPEPTREEIMQAAVSGRPIVREG